MKVWLVKAAPAAHACAERALSHHSSGLHAAAAEFKR